jgi:hypothetical protein
MYFSMNSVNRFAECVVILCLCIIMRLKYEFFSLLAYFPSFEKIKVGLCDIHAVCVSVNPPYQLSNA